MPVLHRYLKMSTISNEYLKSKFRGSLLGALLGDCLGAPYEGDDVTPGERIQIQRYFDKLEEPDFIGLTKQYTDDTAMTKSVAKTLIDKPSVDFQFMAKLFVNEFYREPNRGYGAAVSAVFGKLRSSKFEDIYKPASEQFDGTGSYGNGGAMRVAPLALYFFDNYEGMLEAVTNATRITHTNILGINGAILQSIAVQQALLKDPTDKLDINKFVDDLLDKMRKIELKDHEEGLEGLHEGTPYVDRIHFVKTLLQRQDSDELYDEVIMALGNSISALESVPTAIFCFLKALKDNSAISNLFRKTVQYAINLGGDTDTIASMAGAIAGAYVGQEHINPLLIRHCEFNKETVELADNLFYARGGDKETER